MGPDFEITNYESQIKNRIPSALLLDNADCACNTPPVTVVAQDCERDRTELPWRSSAAGSQGRVNPSSLEGPFVHGDRFFRLDPLLDAVVDERPGKMYCDGVLPAEGLPVALDNDHILRHELPQL